MKIVTNSTGRRWRLERQREKKHGRTADEENRAEKTMSKEDLIDYAVGRYMEEEYGKGTVTLIEAAAKDGEKKHKEAVGRLAELVFAGVSNKSPVDRAVGNIEDALTDTVTQVGDEMYFAGIVEAAGFLGIHITRKDIKKGIGRGNKRREQDNAKWLLSREAKRVIEKLSAPVSIKVEGELTV